MSLELLQYLLLEGFQRVVLEFEDDDFKLGQVFYVVFGLSGAFFFDDLVHHYCEGL